MKLTSIKSNILLAALLCGFAACKKSESAVPKPTISINILSPTEGAIVPQGDTLYIKANITSPLELHGYSWKIKNIKN